jgi:para-nitrobenzyl esterase
MGVTHQKRDGRDISGKGAERRRFLRHSAGVMAAGAAVYAGLGVADGSAPGPASLGPIVATPAGKLQGTVRGGIHTFKGIPYGESTAGANRFMPPVKRKPWAGVRAATRYGHQAPQSMHYTEVLAPQADPAEGFSEDCLVLNVWTPALNDGTRRPVMFWCHGGGFAQESASWPWVDGEALARRGNVVVVTINHRLNIFGYLQLGDMGGEQYAASGVAGMLDLVAGLEWVRDNIGVFGGDPANVMIFGESGGGAKVSTLLAMPSAHGLFHRAAIQSGPSLRGVPREEGAATAQAVLMDLGITAANLNAIQHVPVAKLLAANGGTRLTMPPRGMAVRMGYAPVVDGRFLPTNPFDPVASPVSADVPILVGCNEFEATLFYLPDADSFSLDRDGLVKKLTGMVGGPEANRLVGVYSHAHPQDTPSDTFFRIASDRLLRHDTVRLAERKHAQGRAPVFMYYFTWKSPAMGGRLRAPHTVEIPFVFDNTDVPTVMTRAPSAKALAVKTSEAWIAFAHHGNPNHPGLPQWPAYTPTKRETMVFDDVCKVVADPNGEERQAWSA